MVMGNPGVGKSELCLHARYENPKERPTSTPTVGMDMHLLSNNNKMHPVVLTVWDCTGFLVHEEAICNRIPGTSGFILVYDTGDRKSFESLQQWVSLIKKYSNQDWIGELIGNIKDPTTREVSIEEGVLFAKKYGLNFREMSTTDRSMVKSFMSSLFDKFAIKDQPKIMNLTTPTTKSMTSSKGDIKKEKEEKEKKRDCSIF